MAPPLSIFGHEPSWILLRRKREYQFAVSDLSDGIQSRSFIERPQRRNVKAGLSKSEHGRTEPHRYQADVNEFGCLFTMTARRPVAWIPCGRAA